MSDREKKFTPGPWVVDDVFIISRKDGCLCAFEDSAWVASNYRANANLIAAAPELLEALEAIIDDDPTKATYHEAREMAEAAIKKAYGETP